MVYAIAQDLQDRLGFDLSEDEQALATQLISEAESHIDFYTGKNFNNNPNAVDTFDGSPEIVAWIVINKPLLSVASVTLNGVTLTVGDDYVVYLDTSTIKFIIRLDNQNIDANQNLQNVVITYEWGYDTVPATIKNICLEMAQKSFSQYLAYKNLKGADKISIGDISTAFTKELMLTKKIERLLDRFRSVSLRVI